MGLPQPFNTAKRRVHRKRRDVAGEAPTPPVALSLVEAIYTDSVPSIRLGFERAIDIASLDGTQIVVDDAIAGLQYEAAGTATLLDANTVEIVLNVIGPATGSNWHMTATGATGIVAVDDGGTWAGVTDLELPFP